MHSFRICKNAGPSRNEARVHFNRQNLTLVWTAHFARSTAAGSDVFTRDINDLARNTL